MLVELQLVAVVPLNTLPAYYKVWQQEVPLWRQDRQLAPQTVSLASSEQERLATTCTPVRHCCYNCLLCSRPRLTTQYL